MLTTPDNLLILLGYGRTIPQAYLDIIDDIGYYVGDRLDSLVVSLNAIDEALSSAPLDSMAVKIDKLEVSYTQHLALLKQEGSRILQEISQLLEIPIVYNKYTGRSLTATPKITHSFISYW